MAYVCSYLSDMKVTLDTNILPADDLIASILPGLFEFSIVSVTDREMGGSATQVNISNIPETMVWDESRFYRMLDDLKVAVSTTTGIR